MIIQATNGRPGFPHSSDPTGCLKYAGVTFKFKRLTHVLRVARNSNHPVANEGCLSLSAPCYQHTKLGSMPVVNYI